MAREENSNKDEAAAPTPTPEGLPYNCPMCDFETRILDELQNHIAIAHEEPHSSKKNLICPVCDSTGYPNLEKLNQHIDGHFPEGPKNEFDPPAGNAQEDNTENNAPSTSGYQKQSQGNMGKRSRPMSPNPSRSRSDASLTDGKKRKPNKTGAETPHDQRTERALDQLRVKRKDYFLGQMNRGVLPYVEYHYQVVTGSKADFLGLDDGFSRTTGLTNVISGLMRESAMVNSAGLAMKADHFSVNFHDKGWGCGYRNIQMMWSSMNHIPTFRPHLVAAMTSGRYSSMFPDGLPDTAVPSVTRLQGMIEAAWAHGFDVDGGAQLGELVGGTTWIGATEVYALLSSMGIKCRLIDFWRPTGPNGTHPLLFNALERHFTETPDPKPPVYLQEHGHSVTVSGFLTTRDGRRFAIIYDPGVKAHETMQVCKQVKRLAGDSDLEPQEAWRALTPLLRGLESFKAPQYQILSPVRTANSALEQQSWRQIHSDRQP